jgi:hypothetical protein
MKEFSFGGVTLKTFWIQTSFGVFIKTCFTSHHSTAQHLKHIITTSQIYQTLNRETIKHVHKPLRDYHRFQLGLYLDTSKVILTFYLNFPYTTKKSWKVRI